MVELQIVILAVAGSSPVGHPIPFLILHLRRLIVRKLESPRIKSKKPERSRGTRQNRIRDRVSTYPRKSYLSESGEGGIKPARRRLRLFGETALGTPLKEPTTAQCIGDEAISSRWRRKQVGPDTQTIRLCSLG